MDKTQTERKAHFRCSGNIQVNGKLPVDMNRRQFTLGAQTEAKWSFNLMINVQNKEENYVNLYKILLTTMRASRERFNATKKKKSLNHSSHRPGFSVLLSLWHCYCINRFLPLLPCISPSVTAQHQSSNLFSVMSAHDCERLQQPTRQLLSPMVEPTETCVRYEEYL